MTPNPDQYGYLIQPATTFSIGLIAAIVAIVAILTNRWTTRMRATLDFLERLETQEYYQKRYRTFRKTRLEPNGFIKLTLISTGDEETDRDNCIDYLNIFELIALGIRKGILDEKFFKRAYAPTVVRDWQAAKTLIDDVRGAADPKKGANPDYFRNLEWLVSRWK